MVVLSTNFKNVTAGLNFFIYGSQFSYINNFQCSDSLQINGTTLLGSCLYFQDSNSKYLKNITIMNNSGYSSALGIIICNDLLSQNFNVKNIKIKKKQ